jgi:putative hydrolase of the HAD superfamily
MLSESAILLVFSRSKLVPSRTMKGARTKIIRFILFDVMGVVFTVGDDVEGLLIPYIRSLKPEIPAGRIRDAYRDASLGKMPSSGFWALMGFEETEAADVERVYLESSFTLDAGFIPCARALKERYRLALLSNDVSEWSRYLREYHGVEPLIDAVFISGDLGVRKPDPRIYQIAMDRLGASPSECVFIDDYPERVEAARKLGINAILFNREGHDYSGSQVESFEQLTRLLLTNE